MPSAVVGGILKINRICYGRKNKIKSRKPSNNAKHQNK